MAVRLGNSNPSNFKLGNNQVAKIMKGTVQVWPEAPTSTAFDMTPNSSIDIGIICADLAYNTYYHDGGLGVPGIGDTVYTDSGLTTTFPGVTGFWHKTSIGTVLEIDGSGVVVNTSVCP